MHGSIKGKPYRRQILIARILGLVVEDLQCSLQIPVHSLRERSLGIIRRGGEMFEPQFKHRSLNYLQEKALALSLTIDFGTPKAGKYLLPT